MNICSNFHITLKFVYNFQETFQGPKEVLFCICKSYCSGMKIKLISKIITRIILFMNKKDSFLDVNFAIKLSCAFFFDKFSEF